MLGILISNQDPLSPVVIIELDEVTLRASPRTAGHRLHLNQPPHLGIPPQLYASSALSPRA